MVFPLCDFLFGRCEQIYLIEIFTVANIHDTLFHVDQIIFRLVVFESGKGIASAFHKGLAFRIIFSQAVDYDMHMDVAAFIVTVSMSADKSLMSGKILFGKFQSKQMRLFSGQSAFCRVFRIKTENIMVGFDFIIILVFTVFCVQPFTLHIKREGIAVYQDCRVTETTKVSFQLLLCILPCQIQRKGR